MYVIKGDTHLRYIYLTNIWVFKKIFWDFQIRFKRFTKIIIIMKKKIIEKIPN